MVAPGGGDFGHISHHVTTVCSHDPADALRTLTQSGTPPLLTPSRWNDVVTATLLPGHTCERPGM
eukprot:3605347-Prymnesium_polylepis.1